MHNRSSELVILRSKESQIEKGVVPPRWVWVGGDIVLIIFLLKVLLRYDVQQARMSRTDSVWVPGWVLKEGVLAK